MPSRKAQGTPGRGASGGFTYLIALMAVVVMGFGLTALTQIWGTASQRAREAELLFVGDQFYQAIEAYRRPAELPAEFLGSGACGVVAIWTRRG